MRKQNEEEEKEYEADAERGFINLLPADKIGWYKFKDTHTKDDRNDKKKFLFRSAAKNSIRHSVARAARIA